MVKIEDIMVRDVLTGRKDDGIVSLVEKMQKHRIGAVVIVDIDNVPIGIITERDIIRGLLSFKEELLHKTAQDIMSAPVASLEPSEDIETATIFMALNRIRRVPVTHNNRLVGIVTYMDITQALRKGYYLLEEKAEILADRANKDSLTGLYNKGYMIKALKKHIKLAKRNNTMLAIMMIDLDFFKQVNDTYGHLCGDEILKTLSNLLREKSRSVNIICRYGGDEFIIIAPMANFKSANYFAERLRAAVENYDFSFAENKIRLTLSIGVALWNPKIKSSRELVKKADQALYAAKRNGRNQVQMAGLEVKYVE
jgi:diguanylate cyclase (GGDEF)-like protein